SPQLRLISSLTGQVWKRNEIPEAEYWCRQIRGPVLFHEGMQTLDEAGCNVFLEVGDHPTLLNIGKECMAKDGLTWLPSFEKGKDDWEVMLTSLGSLYIKGENPNWDALSQYYQCRRIALPTYPFQRERCWFSPKEELTPTSRRDGWERQNGATHPLLGQ